MFYSVNLFLEQDIIFQSCAQTQPQLCKEIDTWLGKAVANRNVSVYS